MLMPAVMYIVYDCSGIHLLSTLTLTPTIICAHTCPLPHILEPSLVLDNLNTVMESVNDGQLNDIGFRLHIPFSKREQLVQQYPVVAQRKLAYSVYYLSHHPGPSWRIIATALWEAKELGALEVVQKLYLKGEPCADSCRSA